MKADAWHYELVGSQMGMAVMEHLTPRMVIIHSPPLTSQPPSPALGGVEGGATARAVEEEEEEADHIDKKGEDEMVVDSSLGD